MLRHHRQPFIVFPAVTFLMIAPCLLAVDDASPSATVELIRVDGEKTAFTAVDFKTLPRTTVDAVDRDGQAARYTGVAMHHLLVKAKIPQGEELRGAPLRCFVCVDATDKYRAVFALPEFDPAFTDRVIILADERNGQPLEKGKGPFQIIVPGEKRHSRWVRMVNVIRVIDSQIHDEKSKPSPP